MPREPLHRRSLLLLVALAFFAALHAASNVEARCRAPLYEPEVVTSLEQPLGPNASLLVELAATYPRHRPASIVRFLPQGHWRLPEVSLLGDAGHYVLAERGLTANFHAFTSASVVPPGRYQLLGFREPRSVQVGGVPRYPTGSAPQLTDVDVSVFETAFTCRGGYVGQRIAARFRADPAAHGVAFVRLLSPSLGPALIDLRGGERDPEGRIVDTRREYRCRRYPEYGEHFGESGPYTYELVYEDGSVQPGAGPVPVGVVVPPDLGQGCRRR